jgi:hypothetical protein
MPCHTSAHAILHMSLTCVRPMIQSRTYPSGGRRIAGGDSPAMVPLGKSRDSSNPLLHSFAASHRPLEVSLLLHRWALPTSPLRLLLWCVPDTRPGRAH